MHAQHLRAFLQEGVNIVETSRGTTQLASLQTPMVDEINTDNLVDDHPKDVKRDTIAHCDFFSLSLSYNWSSK